MRWKIKTWVGVRGAMPKGLHHAAEITRQSKLITAKIRAVSEVFSKNIISTSREILLLSFTEDSSLRPGFIYRNDVLAVFLLCFSFVCLVHIFYSFFSFRTTHCFLELLQ